MVFEKDGTYLDGKKVTEHGWQNLSWKSRNIFQSGLESKKMRYTKEA